MLERVWTRGNPPTWRECNLVQPPRRTAWRVLKLKSELWYVPASPLPGMCPEKPNLKRCRHHSVHCNAVYSSQDKQPTLTPDRRRADRHGAAPSSGARGSATPRAAARQAPLPMGSSRRGHCSGCHFPLLGISRPGDRAWASCIGRRVLHHRAGWEAPFLNSSPLPREWLLPSFPSASPPGAQARECPG